MLEGSARMGARACRKRETAPAKGTKDGNANIPMRLFALHNGFRYVMRRLHLHPAALHCATAAGNMI